MSDPTSNPAVQPAPQRSIEPCRTATEPPEGVTVFKWPRKPDIDERSYCYFRLASNNLQVLLIQDPKANRAAASMSVGVGHMQDPPSYPGLAHFCEHMCFLGSDKYPDEGAYHEHIARHGGHANAFTSLEETNYAFEIGPEQLLETLDRFAQCFLHPRFHKAAVGREVDAVDAEYRMNIQSDTHRLFQLLKSLADPVHPFHNFGTGNRETLLGSASAAAAEAAAEPHQAPTCLPAAVVESQESVREALCEFHRQYYGADLMCLCVSFTAHQTMAEMQSAVWSLFGEVPRALQKAPAASYAHQPLFREDHQPQGKLYVVEPVKALREMRIVFTIPPQRPLYRTKPAHCLAHLLGHESNGSLLAALKEHGFATALSAGVSWELTGIAFFDIDIALTERGLVHWQQTLSLVGAYLRLLRTLLGPGDILDADLPSYIYEELQLLGEIHFRYQERESSPFQAVVELSSSLRVFDPEDVLAGPFLYWDRPSACALRELLSEHMCPEQAIVFLVTTEMYQQPEAYGLESTQLVHGLEPWYQTRYLTGTMPAAAWYSETPAARALHVPLPNPFMPRSFSLKVAPAAGTAAADANGQQPLPRCLLLDEAQGRVLHHSLDTSFRQPRIQAFFQLYTDMAYASPEQAIFTKLAIALIEDALTASAYDAELAGMSYTLTPTATGVFLGLSGFADTFIRFTEHVFRTAAATCSGEDVKQSTEIRQRLLDAHLDRLRRSYEDAALQKPYQQVMYNTRVLLQLPHWHATWDYLSLLREASSAGTERFSLESVDAFRTTLFGGASGAPGCSMRNLVVEALLHGNVTEDEARLLFDRCMAIVQPCLRPEVGDLRQFLRRLECHQLRIPAELSPLGLFIPLPNATESNASLGYYVQTGVRSLERDLLVEVLSNLLQKPLFHELRTVQQLGYVVSNFVYRRCGAQGLFFLVQSTERHPPWHVAERLECFLHDFYQNQLQRLRVDDLRPYLEAMAEKREEPDRNLPERGARFWAEIGHGTYQYQRGEQEARYLRALLKQDTDEAATDVNATGTLSLVKFHALLRTFWENEVCGHRHGGSLRVYAVPFCWMPVEGGALQVDQVAAYLATKETQQGLEERTRTLLLATAASVRKWQQHASRYPSEREYESPPTSLEPHGENP